MTYRGIFTALLGASMLTACGNIPAPDYFSGRDDSGPAARDRLATRLHVEDLVKHIECELVNAPNLSELLTNPDPSKLDRVSVYVAQVTLTLKVADNGGLSPSLSFINPLTTGGSFAYGLNGNLNLERQRIFTASYFIDLNKLLRNKDGLDACKPGGSGTSDDPMSAPSLSGDLGINGIMAAALAARSRYPNYTAADSSKNASVLPSFGTTVQFTLTATFDTGPGWALTDIKGPSGSKGILNGGMVDTDTMLIAFSTSEAPPQKPTPITDKIHNILTELRAIDVLRKNGLLRPQDIAKEKNLHTKLQAALDDARTAFVDNNPQAEAASAANAAGAAQNLTTNMILQNLTGTLH